MTKKVFALSGSDLILTKYYKERLESQLKNRKIYINEKNLTESIILSLPINILIFSEWISTLKP